MANGAAFHQTFGEAVVAFARTRRQLTDAKARKKTHQGQNGKLEKSDLCLSQSSQIESLKQKPPASQKTTGYFVVELETKYDLRILERVAKSSSVNSM